MKDNPKIGKYKHDEQQENYLLEFNQMLLPLEKELTAKFTKPYKPVVFIVGAPRCGSTLLAQLLASTSVFFSVNNFVARFWMSPYIGSCIARGLGFGNHGSNFKSDYGITEGWNEPHEFGYFWRRWFRYSKNNQTHKLSDDELELIDVAYLNQELAAMEDVFEKPLVFKCGLNSLQIPFLARNLRSSIFLVCRRNPLYNAQSLLVAREKVHGRKNIWYSLRPKEYLKIKDKSVFEQVVAQYFYIYKDIFESLSQIESSRYLVFEYEEICEAPGRAINRVLGLLQDKGYLIEYDGQMVQPFTSEDKQKLPDQEFSKLKKACVNYFKEVKE